MRIGEIVTEQASVPAAHSNEVRVTGSFPDGQNGWGVEATDKGLTAVNGTAYALCARAVTGTV